MERSLKFHKTYLRIAAEIATLSRCERLQVGCIIVKDGNIISFGFNGTPPGQDNQCECNGSTKPNVVHAEINAMLKLQFNVVGCDMYVTHSPCQTCTEVIKECGIRKVYFTHRYRIDEHLKTIQHEQIECTNNNTVCK